MARSVPLRILTILLVICCVSKLVLTGGEMRVSQKHDDLVVTASHVLESTAVLQLLAQGKTISTLTVVWSLVGGHAALSCGFGRGVCSV